MNEDLAYKVRNTHKTGIILGFWGYPDRNLASLMDLKVFKGFKYPYGFSCCVATEKQWCSSIYPQVGSRSIPLLGLSSFLCIWFCDDSVRFAFIDISHSRIQENFMVLNTILLHQRLGLLVCFSSGPNVVRMHEKQERLRMLIIESCVDYKDV